MNKQSKTRVALSGALLVSSSLSYLQEDLNPVFHIVFFWCAFCLYVSAEYARNKEELNDNIYRRRRPGSHYGILSPALFSQETPKLISPVYEDEIFEGSFSKSTETKEIDIEAVLEPESIYLKTFEEERNINNTRL